MDGQQQEQETQEARRVFALLRSLCKQLLDDPNATPASIAHLLDTLASQLKDVSSYALQGCMDYVLFPLFILLDTAVATRSSGSSGDDTGGSTTRLRIAVTDRMVEGVVLCLEVVLKKCSLQNKYQMVTMLKSLTAAAMLTPSEASEEFRHGVVRCLKASFLSLKSCGDVSCMCCSSSSPPQHGYGHDCTFYAEHVWTRCMEVSQGTTSEIIESCHLAYLQSEEMRVAIGHLFSVLLKISETEASLGAVGSTKLRVDALSTLRVVIWKVGSADALSFFLPGVVSSLSKGIQNSNSRSRDTPSFTLGARGSPGALAESVRCMGDIVAFVLGDLQNTATLHKGVLIETKEQTGGSSFSADEALERLRAVSVSSNDGSKQRSQQTAVGQMSSARDISPFNAVTSHPVKPAAADFHVERHGAWLQSTAARINSILVHALPSLCTHSTPAIRLAVVDFSALLLGACALTLRNCTELLLECLLSFACDEWKQVSLAACSYLAALVSSSSDSRLMHLIVKHNISAVTEEARMRFRRGSLLGTTSRLIMGLPRAMYSADEKAVVLHTRKLAAAMYFAGADTVSKLLLNSPVTITEFIKVMSQGFSFSTAFSGSMSYLVTRGLNASSAVDHVEVEELSTKRMRSTRSTGLDEYISDKAFHQEDLSSASLGQPVENLCSVDQLPRAPPWLVHGGDKMYRNMSCILRLTGLSAVKGQKHGAGLTTLMEPLLAMLRQVTGHSEGNESVVQSLAQQSAIFDTGHQIREAAGAAALISEVLYGASGAWATKLVSLFERPSFIRGPSHGMVSQACGGDTEFSSALQYYFQEWTTAEGSCSTTSIVSCVSNILHEYMEIWNVLDVSIMMSGEIVNSSSHVVHDILMLEQVLVEGVGVCAIALGKAFDEAGFLGLVLCPLLERLGSSYYNVSHAADIVLRTISYQCGYSSAKALVKENADHIVDSLCRQLRHTQMHPNAPRLLAAILQHTGAAPDFVPLLHEPVRSIQIELEIPARQQHPEHVVPLLLGIREISKAVKAESTLAASKARDSVDLVQTILSCVKKEHDQEDERFDNLITDIEERQQSSRAIGSLALSCMVTCVPLLSAKEQQVCLLALDTVEHSIGCLADLEALDKIEKSTKLQIRDHGGKSSSLFSEDGSKDDESGNTRTKLLPSMHRLWPHLVLCLQHRKSPVVIRALTVIAHATFLGGGEFFNRRMKKDALPLMVKLLCNQRSSDTGKGLVLQRSSDMFMLQQKKAGDPHGQESYSSPAEVLKVQHAVIDCVTSIARSTKSAPALAGLVGVVASWILALGCALTGLQDAAAEALLALSSIDADLVWVLAADLALGAPETAAPTALGIEFPPFTEIFPPLASPKDALWLQYTAHKEGLLNVDRTVAGKLLVKLNSCKDEL